MLFVAHGAHAQTERRVPANKHELTFSYAPLVRKAAPAVVNIYTRKVVKTRGLSPLFNDPFFRRFFGEGFGMSTPRERVQNSLGSGVILRSEGLIVTNHHVIEGADEITIVLSDKREFEAEIIGVDEKTDLAVLQVDTNGEKLPFLELSNSDSLEVGDIVLAIGNPFGVGQTVTSGIVSALARTKLGVSDFGSFIQTDAAINPGNSGGALIDMNGRVVGINTAIFSKSGGSHGIGFAIPSNMVRIVVAGTSKGERLVRAWFGAWGQGVNADIAESLGMRYPRGVLLKKIYPKGPADKAGLQAGDILLAINGHSVNDTSEVSYRIATLAIGGQASLDVVRRGRPVKLKLRLAPPPEIPPRDVTILSGRHPLSGAQVANMSPALAEEVGLDEFEAGVYILKMKSRSSAARMGFRSGDRMISVDNMRITSVNELVRVMEIPTQRWSISIKRDGKTLKLVIDR